MCGLDRIVRLFLSLFPHCELSHFSNLTCVFFMVGGFVYGLGITVKTFLSLFQHCELSHFHPLYIDSGYLL